MLGALACAAFASTFLRPAPTSGPFARDFEAYYAAGATWNAGGDPWSRDVWAVERTIPDVDASHDEILPFVGPAASLPLWSLLARLPFPDARVVWEALIALAFAALVLCSLAMAGVRPTPLDLAATVVTTVICGPVLSDFALGQVAMLGAGGVALALVAFERGAAWGAAATVLAAVQPNLALPLASRLTDRRTVVVVAIAVAAFLAITLACGGGITGLMTYVARVGEHGAGERFIAIQYALPAIVASFGASHATASALAGIVTTAVVTVAAFVAVRFRAQPVLAACIAIALLPLAVPFFHEHDFVIEIVPVLVLATRFDTRVRSLTGIAAAFVLVDWFGFAQRPAAIGHIIAFGFATALAFAALPRRDRASVRDFAPALTVLVLSAIGVPLALAAPAPTWPDALPATYHAAASLDISTVWAQEQQRAGLGAAVPAWGALRAIPLAGCALLAVAGCFALRSPRANRSGSDIDV